MRASIPYLALALSLAGPAASAAQDARVPLRPPAPLIVGGHDFGAPQVATQSEDGPHLHHRIFSAVGSAALGAGIGFFASHLASSDWQDPTRQSNRNAWAVAGGSLGFTVGLSFPVFGRGGGAIERRSVAPLRGRDAITAEQVREASVMNAYEAVRIYRPQWLVARTPDTLGDPVNCTRPVCPPEPGTLRETARVYLDQIHFGDTESLRQINALTISEIRFIEGPAATLRWGTGHNYGVIQVVTVGGRAG
jgi:hypothetical protein